MRQYTTGTAKGAKNDTIHESKAKGKSESKTKGEQKSYT